MFQQSLPINRPLYCKLIPQPSLDNSGMTYLLELLPTNDMNQFPQNITNQNNLINTGFIQPIQGKQPPINMICQKRFNPFHYQKIIRKKVDLDQNALKFKEKFYSFFTYRKRIPKDLVFNIHNNIAQKINLRLVTREECRSVDKYFKNFAIYQKEIITYLSSLPNEQRNQLIIKSHHPYDQPENAQ